MTTESIDIRVREDGSRTVRRNLDDIGGSAVGAERNVRLLQSALGALGGFLAIGAITQYADAWTVVNGLIATSTKNAKEHLAVQKELMKIAQNTGTEIDTIAQLYSRLARSGKEMGVSQKDIIKFTDGIAKSLSIQGTTSQAASGALLQLGQAMGSGIVRAQEFNSLLEGAPIILQYVAENIEGVDGSIAKLRARMIDGKLTSQEFFQAYLAASEAIDTAYAETGLTFSGGMTVMKNGLKEFFGEMNNAAGVSTLFFKSMQFIAQHLDLIAIALAAVGIGLAIAFAPAAIMAFGRALMSVFAIITAHPLIALATAIAAVIMYLVAMSDQLNAGIDDVTTVADVGAAAWEGFADVVGDVYDYLFMVNKDGNSAMLDDVKLTTNDMGNAYTTFFDGTMGGFMGFVQGVARLLDAIAGLLTGMAIAVARAVMGLPAVVVNAFNQMYNAIISIVENTINAGINGINRLRSMVGIGLMDAVQIQRKEVTAKAYKEYGENLGKSINDGFAAQGGYMEQQVKNLASNAQLKAKQRIARGGDAADLSTPMGTPGKNAAAEAAKKAAKEKKPKEDKSAEKAAKEAERALERLTNEYQRLLDVVDPLLKVQMDFNKEQKTLDAALKAGLVTQAKHNEYTAKLKDHYKDLLDPLGKLKREWAEEVELLKMGADAREVEGSLRQHIKNLAKEGIVVTEQETAALREQLETIQKLTKEQQLRKQIEDQVKTSRGTETMDKIGMLGQMKGSGEITGVDASGIAGSMIEGMGLDNSNSPEAIAVRKTQLEQYYEQLDAMRETDLISEQTHSALKMQLWNMENKEKLAGVQSMLGSLASLQNSNSKKLARVGKAAAIAQAVINTYQSATGAYASMSLIPYVGPALGVAAAAAAVAAGMANVQAIRKQNVAGYMNGGFTGTGGLGDIAGVVHGQEYVMDAATTSNIGVDNLDALRRGQMSLTPTNSESQKGATTLNVTIENNGTYKDFEVQQLSETDVRIIARDEAENVVTKRAGSVVAKELTNANSDPSKALSRNTTAERNR